MKTKTVETFHIQQRQRDGWFGLVAEPREAKARKILQDYRRGYKDTKFQLVRLTITSEVVG